MTRNKYRKLYYQILGTTHLRKEFWHAKREDLIAFQEGMTINNMYVNTYISVKGIEFMKQHEAKAYEEKKLAKANDAYWKNVLSSQVNPCSLGNCEAVTPVTFYDPIYGYSKCNPALKNAMQFATKTDCMQEKGNNPMRIDNTTATAYVTAPKSDDATSRDYLLSRLAIYEGWRSPKIRELSELFNLSENGKPKSYLQLIDAIKNGKYTLDDKAIKRLKNIQENLLDDDEDGELEEAAEGYGYGPFYGIVFTDLPKADQMGYDVAVKELDALVKTTKDTIMVKSPTEGLSALQALEAWTPAGKAN